MNNKMNSLDVPDRLLTRREAALHLGVSPKTLANWKALGKGPDCFAYGDGWLRYSTADLAAWLEDHRVEAAA